MHCTNVRAIGCFIEIGLRADIQQSIDDLLIQWIFSFMDFTVELDFPCCLHFMQGGSSHAQ